MLCRRRVGATGNAISRARRRVRTLDAGGEKQQPRGDQTMCANIHVYPEATLITTANGLRLDFGDDVTERREDLGVIKALINQIALHFFGLIEGRITSNGYHPIVVSSLKNIV